MERFDNQMAARVWQRVQGDQASGSLSGDVLLLLAEEAEDAAVYRQLSKTQSKDKATVLARLFRDSQQCIHTLRGMHYLLTGTFPESVPVSPRSVPTPLHRCYGSTLRRCGRYEQWSSHSEYGAAFSQMAALSQSRCASLLQLIGMQSSQDK